MKKIKLVVLNFLFVVIAFTASAQEKINRPNLPVSNNPEKGKVGMTVKESEPVKFNPISAPKGAPNVIIMLLDDVGFGAAETFGGAIATPNLSKLASQGLIYNEFHTTALCSPSRAALLTGRNQHRVNCGSISEYATAFEGYTGSMPMEAATVAEVLKDNGYNTAAYGKWHNTPVWEVSTAGPFDRWPTGLGFEEFYGFIAGETHQYFPALVHGTTHIERPEDAKDYMLTTDLTDHAIQWMNTQKAVAPEKPFFIYYAPGATHAPHHVAPEWVKPFEGKFNQGWDKLREETFARQKKLGVIPKDAILTPRHASIPTWETLTPDAKKIASRLMEVYAGYLAYADYESGRLIDAVKALGQFDNTMIIYIVGDNGAAGAGTIKGVYNEMVSLNGMMEDPKVVMSKLDEFGGPKANNEYPVGFAWAMNTPFQFTKQVASHFGGTSNPVIITWPNGMKAKNEIREQFHHLIDIVPTIYEAAGITAPKTVNGIEQMSIDGVSMLYTFDDKTVKTKRNTQYFEVFGARGIYNDGWMASTRHNSQQWAPIKKPAFADDVWELYNINEDFSQAKDLAAKNPEKLKELQQLFIDEAQKNNVFPLDDRGPDRVVGTPLPSPAGAELSFSYKGKIIGLPEDVVRKSFNKSFTMTAEIEVGKTTENSEGVIATAGGYFGGFSLFIQKGIPKYTYNYFGSKYTTLSGVKPLPSGKVILKYEFVYDGGGLGKGGTAKLYVNNELADTKIIEATTPLGFSGDETFDIGEDTGTPGSDLYEGLFAYKDKIISVGFDIVKPEKK
jgi:arylsulfatase A-like enzyme